MAWVLPIGGFRTVINEYCPPPKLKIIAFCSVGYDHEDAKVLLDHGIALTNVPSDGLLVLLLICIIFDID